LKSSVQAAVVSLDTKTVQQEQHQEAVLVAAAALGDISLLSFLSSAPLEERSPSPSALVVRVGLVQLRTPLKEIVDQMAA
jgi:hypothetical protein